MAVSDMAVSDLFSVTLTPTFPAYLARAGPTKPAQFLRVASGPNFVRSGLMLRHPGLI